MKTVDIIVPCYNEAEGLDLFYQETEKVVSRIDGYEFSYIFINDGSRDASLSVMRRLAQEHPRVHYISFSRNFGKEAGMYAGLRHSSGDYVIIINAEKVAVTGKKKHDKIYKRHTGYPGGLRELNFEQMMEKHPTEVVRHAIKGMMPKGKLGRQMFKKLKVYAGPEHNHAAQKPEALEI